MNTTASLTHEITYNETKPAISVLLETEASKEIRIVMKAGQLMKKHKAPFPIVIELFEGSIDFGVNEDVLQLTKGDLIALDASVPHDLKCTSDCIIRLSLSKLDTLERVKSV
jgi:quercetin dioxygenase-like cupin family protein